MKFYDNVKFNITITLYSKMSKGKGWFLESERHKLSRLGIKTGRKIHSKSGKLQTSGQSKSMFYPKKKNTKKKIVKGALIGAGIGALTYKGKIKKGERIYLEKSIKGSPLRWGTYKQKDWEVPSDEYEVVKVGKNKIKIALASGKFVSVKHIYEIPIKTAKIKKLNYKNNPIPKARYRFDKIIKKGKYKGMKPRYAFVNNKVVEIAYFKGKKKVKVKKLNYPQDVEELPIEDKPTFLRRVKTGVKVGVTGIKTGIEKAKEYKEKYDVYKEEREVKELEKAQRQLVKLRAEKQVIDTKEEVKKLKEEIRKKKPSLLGDLFSVKETNKTKNHKSLIDDIFR